jgi:hypothetical protein
VAILGVSQQRGFVFLASRGKGIFNISSSCVSVAGSIERDAQPSCESLILTVETGNAVDTEASSVGEPIHSIANKANVLTRQFSMYEESTAVGVL